ncbi:MAG: STAS domain-containing protein [Thermomicrobiales bacterium]|nr:STAS domain-containing protein [Thermomicrobiales bacterium]
MSSIVLAISAAITSIALMPLFKELPLAVLSAIVINAVMGFVNVPALRRILNLRRDSFVFALLALLGVLFIGVLPGLLITVILSLVLLLGHIGRPQTEQVAPIPDHGVAVAVAHHPELETPPGLLLLRPDAPLLFVNAAWVRDDVRAQIDRQQTPISVVVLDLEATADLDISALDTLESLAHDLASEHMLLWLSNVQAKAFSMLQREGVLRVIGADRVFASVKDAQDAFDATYSVGQDQE